MKISRRKIMMMTAMLGMGSLLTACETTTVGNTTTHTLNVAKVKMYATAGLNAANAVASVLALNPSFSVFVPPIRAASEMITNTLTSFTDVVGDKIEISYDDTNFKTLVDTLIDNLDQLLTTIGAASISILKDNLGLSTAFINKVVISRDALATLVSVFKIVVGDYVSTASGPGAMTEDEAFKVLGV